MPTVTPVPYRRPGHGQAVRTGPSTHGAHDRQRGVSRGMSTAAHKTGAAASSGPATGRRAIGSRGRGRRPGQAVPQGTRRLAGRGQLPGRAGARSSDSSGRTVRASPPPSGSSPPASARPGAGRWWPGSTWWPTRSGARRVLGVVPQQNNLDRSLSVRQNLLFHASYHGVPRAERTRLADALLEQFGLADRPDGRPDDFSGGQIQRMMIARALMHAPSVLFLDEPSTGLDPAARLFLWEKVAELKAAGTTVVITTHDMDEAATLERPGGHHRPRDPPRPRHAGRPRPGDGRRAHPRLHGRARARPPTPAPSRTAIGSLPGVRRDRAARRPGHRRLAAPDLRGGRGRRIRRPGGPGRQRRRWDGSPMPGWASPISRTSSST